MRAGEHLDLSVVIPAYNSAPYLEETLEACARAVAAAGWRAEVVVVDDGSTDGTSELLGGLAPSFPLPLRAVRQENKGRFLARWAGLERAEGRLVLLLDSRVILDDGALVAVVDGLSDEASVWNGHAVTDPGAALVGHFWEVPTYVFWGRWLGRPRRTSFGADDFNRYPKGTGVLVAPRALLVDAFVAAWPEGDAALASDDTKLIRWIAERARIQLDPGFRATYRPRTTVSGFVRHSLGRGTFLVDSFGGTSLTWSVALVALALAPVLVVGTLGGLIATGRGQAAAALLGASVLAAESPAVVAAARGCPRRGLASYATFLPVFVLPYWAGLLRGLVVHRRVLLGRRPAA